MDFSAELQRIEGWIAKGGYTPAATRSMIVIEQALRRLAAHYLDRIDPAARRRVEEAAQKVPGRRTITKALQQRAPFRSGATL